MRRLELARPAHAVVFVRKLLRRRHRRELHLFIDRQQTVAIKKPVLKITSQQPVPRGQWFRRHLRHRIQLRSRNRRFLKTGPAPKHPRAGLAVIVKMFQHEGHALTSFQPHAPAFAEARQRLPATEFQIAHLQLAAVIGMQREGVFAGHWRLQLGHPADGKIIARQIKHRLPRSPLVVDALVDAIDDPPF